MTTLPTWLEELVERSGRPRLQLAAQLVAAMSLLLAGAAYLDGVLALTPSAGFWRVAMGSPAMVGYVVLFQPVLKRWRDAAIQAFRPLAAVDDQRFQMSLAQASIFNRRNERIAAVIGIVAGLLLLQPWDRGGSVWNWSPVGQSTWLTAVGLLQTLLVYGFVGYFVYSVMSGTTLFTEVYAGELVINAFALDSLLPVASWSLGIAAYFAGGITLSVLTLPSVSGSVSLLIGYVPVTAAPVLVFFLNLRTLHTAMVQAKELELDTVRANLVAASEALRHLPSAGKEEQKSALLTSIADWKAHQDLVKALPEWPFTGETTRRLALSSLVPVVVGLAQTVLPLLLRQYAPPLVLDVLRQLLPLAW